jgi:hypothetical protein
MALALIALVGVAHADVQVRFTDPSKFSDIKDNDGFSRPEVLKDIEAHLVAQASKRLPGRNIRFEVTDVDLAGEVEPVGHGGRWLRVMRSVTSPSLSLNYEVLEAGKVVQQGQARLRDLDYQSAFNVYSGGDPLRYERRMIDRWLDREFSPAVAAAAPH